MTENDWFFKIFDKEEVERRGIWTFIGQLIAFFLFIIGLTILVGLAVVI